jgi:hypothetical protein
MASKKLSQRNRAIAINKIKMEVQNLYREDLLALAAAINDALLAAKPTPAEERLTAPGEWLEERHVASKTPGTPGKDYVYLRWMDGDKERGTLIFHGTLAEYKADRLAQ